VDTRQAIVEQIPHLRRYARALRRDAGPADDLVQDCLERALSRVHLFRAGTNIRTWLFTILHNLNANQARRASRRPDDAELENEAEPAAHAGEGPDRRLLVRDLGRALDKLADEQRTVLLLIGLEDMSYKEASEVLGVPVGTVMSRLARGRERLRQLMDDGNAPALRRVK
jgi:RNA polymerase sigma-70 factor (ECF subfamily)